MNAAVRMTQSVGTAITVRVLCAQCLEYQRPEDLVEALDPAQGDGPEGVAMVGALQRDETRTRA